MLAIKNSRGEICGCDKEDMQVRNVDERKK